MAGETVKTSIVLPADLHWRLKRAAVDRRLADTAAIREAIQQWIEGRREAAAEPGTLTPDEQRLLAEYRSASWEKRRRILAVTAKIEELVPELVPERHRAPEAKPAPDVPTDKGSVRVLRKPRR